MFVTGVFSKTANSNIGLYVEEEEEEEENGARQQQYNKGQE